jgi:hypothetical protein
MSRRYAAICARRDQVLTHAVAQVAKHILAQSNFQADESLDETQNNQNAINMLQDYLSERSSVPEMEQRLLALVGRGVLFNKMIPEDMVGELRLIGPIQERLDPMLVHRIARALDRSQEQAPMLWRFVEEQLSEEDDPLVQSAIRLLLDDATLSTLDESIEKMILDSIPGG